jgi:hypothetical protein
MVNHIVFPNSNSKMRTLTRSFNGAGYGTVLLDGGLGGQSSYSNIDDYIEKTGRDPRGSNGRGLSDKISNKLQNLKIDHKPKRKNISLSI